MRITPPKAEIDIYNDGLEKHDLLARATQSKNLSSIVEEIDEPLVVAIDGAWGSGKTFFLKCWVGAHTLENSGSATTVYFDAFENDFLDDPLIGLTGALASRADEESSTKKALRMAKIAAAKIWRPTARIGLAIGTAGASEIAGTVVDSGLDAASKELGAQVDEFWKKESGKRAAMKEFRAALIKLTDPDENGLPTKKFVFVVDELDRCRPDFALDTLEVIKHFFFVPGVHFVLGVNFSELLNTVKVRYGDKVDALTYLQKFVTISISLPELVEFDGKPTHTAERYYRAMLPKMGLQGKLLDDVHFWIRNFEVFQFSSVRHAQRVLTEIALIPKRDSELERMYHGWRLTLAALVLIKHAEPNLFKKARLGTLSFKDMVELLDLPKTVDADSRRALQVADRLWRSILSPLTLKQEEQWQQMWGSFGLDSPKDVIPDLLRDFLDAVSLTEEAFDG